jgi:competence protein ComEA
MTRIWIGVCMALLIIVVVTGTLVWTKLPRSQPIEIVLASPPELKGQAYIVGEVVYPGIYHLRAGDSLNDMIIAAGGFTLGADLSRLEIRIPVLGEKQLPQKIDINRAEPWLLQALPDIGETRAKTIVEYRMTNGPFRATTELRKVPGIGDSTYEKIKDIITIAE